MYKYRYTHTATTAAVAAAATTTANRYEKPAFNRYLPANISPRIKFDNLRGEMRLLPRLCN